MAKKVLIQAGHNNIKNHCDQTLRNSTGSSGEMQINTAVRDALVPMLQKYGIDAVAVDATYGCKDGEGVADYDLALALHCDGNSNKDVSGGFADAPDPSVDHVNDRSKELAKFFNDNYFENVGIPYVNRSTVDSRFYYWWRYLSANTPCVLVELGFVSGNHDNPILKDTQKVATALLISILKAFKIPFQDPCEDAKEKAGYWYDALKLVNLPVDSKWSVYKAKINSIFDSLKQKDTYMENYKKQVNTEMETLKQKVTNLEADNKRLLESKEYKFGEAFALLLKSIL